MKRGEIEMVKQDCKYVGYKFKIYPTDEQIVLINKYFGLVRYVFNLGLEMYMEHYNNAKDDPSIQYKSMTFVDLNNKLTKLKNTREDMQWLKDYSSGTMRVVLQDLIGGYKKFYDHVTPRPPKFKTKKNANQSFPVRKERMSILGNMLKISGFSDPILIKGVPSKLQGFGDKAGGQKIGGYTKFNGYSHLNFINPRISYNGIDYFISFQVERKPGLDKHDYNSTNKFKHNEFWDKREYGDIIGLDWGMKHDNWYVCSDGDRLHRPDQSKLDRQIAGYQRSLARKKRINNKKHIERTNQYTKNELKTLKRLNKKYKQRTNQRLNPIHEFANYLISKKPRAIVLEDIKVTNFLQSGIDGIVKHSMDSIKYTSSTIIAYKAEANGIPVIVAHKGFKSTQICSNCGNEQNVKARRTYKCPHCGLVIDRDINAAINLKKYGEEQLSIYNVNVA